MRDSEIQTGSEEGVRLYLVVRHDETFPLVSGLRMSLKGLRRVV